MAENTWISMGLFISLPKTSGFGTLLKTDLLWGVQLCKPECFRGRIPLLFNTICQ